MSFNFFSFPRQQQPSGPGTTSTKLSTTPPRPLATRPWAAAMPTLLSHSAFNKLLSPVLVAPVLPYGAPVAVSPLERFLGSINLKRHLTRVVVSDTKVSVVSYVLSSYSNNSNINNNNNNNNNNNKDNNNSVNNWLYSDSCVLL